MKKIMLVLLFATVAFVGCKKQEAPMTPPPAEAPMQPPAGAPAAPADAPAVP